MPDEPTTPEVEAEAPAIDPELQADIDRLAELDDEALTDLRARLATAIETARAEDPTEESLASLEALVTATESVAAEQTAREEAAAERQRRQEELAARADALAETPEPEAETEPEAAPETEPAPEPEAAREPIAAAAPAPRAPIRTAPRTEPAPAETPRLRAALVASSGGRDLPDIAEVADEMARVHRHFSGPSAREERAVVASARWDYPEERMVRSDRDAAHNSGILAATGVDPLSNPAPEALTAAGGLCAPLAPVYDMIRVSDDRRPVRDSLAQYGATRGGVNFVASPSLADFSDAVGVWTVDNDEEAATDDSVRKDCVRVDCEGATEAQIEAIYSCLTFGNLGARAFPEQVANAVAVTGDAHAQLAERQLLAKIRAASVGPVTAQTVLGASRDFLTHLNRWGAAKRGLHRMPRTAPLAALFPEWVLDAIIDDLTRQQPGDDAIGTSIAEINGYLSNINVDVTWFATNDHDQADQRFGTQGAGPLAGYPGGNPARVEGYGFHPGAHVFMDGGELDLGLVRDSSLNSSNDYQMFMETFEGLYTPGLFSDILRLDLCVSGTSSAADIINDSICSPGS